MAAVPALAAYTKYVCGLSVRLQFLTRCLYLASPVTAQVSAHKGGKPVKPWVAWRRDANSEEVVPLKKIGKDSSLNVLHRTQNSNPALSKLKQKDAKPTTG